MSKKNGEGGEKKLFIFVFNVWTVRLCLTSALVVLKKHFEIEVKN